MKKNIAVLAMSLVVMSSNAMANNFDVVKDTNGHIVKNTFNNCVLTKWEAAEDACAEKVEKQAEVVEPVVVPARKPIKHSRSYLVFFDFDKSNLTPSAIDIIKKASSEAQSSSSEVNFAVTGHADRSGSDAYNVKLSQRRANAVRSELEKLGSKHSNIETSAKGEFEPLVPTEDGVKEPQNRRVEIIYSIEK